MLSFCTSKYNTYLPISVKNTVNKKEATTIIVGYKKETERIRQIN
jgi:hypothetical protein